MENDVSIESLIASTITHIKTALDSNKPENAKVYTEILYLLKYTLNIRSEKISEELPLNSKPLIRG